LVLGLLIDVLKHKELKVQLEYKINNKRVDIAVLKNAIPIFFFEVKSNKRAINKLGL
jgi:type I site-specific restriction-modification system R (restriction) subunit